jgi:hypothetical protein
MNNVHYYRTSLIIHGITYDDYGAYYCRANNLIGQNIRSINLNRKRKLVYFLFKDFNIKFRNSI